MGGVEKKKEELKPYWIQPEPRKKIADKIWREFDKYRTNRDRIFSYFRERNCITYWNDSDQRFNNYRIKPGWKEKWQANISDITTHSKLMSIAAQVVANRLRPEFYPKFTRDIFAKFKAQLFQNIYEHTETTYRDGELDDLFTVIETAKRGTSIGFEGWLKTDKFEGIHAELIPLEDFYPQYINKFRMEDQDRCVWRTIAFKDDADKVFGKYKHYEKVKAGGEHQPEDLTFFNVSNDVAEDKVEILRWFDKIDDEFHIVINGVLITDPGSKLSARRKDGELGFWKAVYEPFSPHFFFGRSLPDLMMDNQDAIDFAFNAVFDQEMLATLKPLFTSGVTQLVDDYITPGRIYQGIESVSTPDYKGASTNIWNVLQELRGRQDFISVDKAIEGVAPGRRTAHEVERAYESAKRIMGLFTTLYKNAIQFKAKLRAGTIMQFMLNKTEIKPIIMKSVQMFNGKEGERIIRMKAKPSPHNIFGFSKELAIENAMMGGEQSEIVEFSPKEIRDFEFEVGVRVPPAVEMSGALQKAFDERFAQIALARPDLFEQVPVARNLAKAMNQKPDEVVKSQQEEAPLEESLGRGKSPTSPKPLKELAIEGGGI